MDDRSTPDGQGDAWAAVSVVGPDALDYLQSQVSQDLQTEGDWPRWSLVLNPDGTVVSAGLVDIVESGFDIVVPEATADAVLTRLLRFRLRSRCELSVRRAVRGPYENEADRVRAGWPGPGEFSADLVPQCFGDQFVRRTVSFTKGCFTGQELVGRLDARGSSVPWRLVRAQGRSVDEIDAFLKSKGPAGPSGVTSWISGESTTIGLGFAHRTLLNESPPTGLALETLD